MSEKQKSIDEGAGTIGNDPFTVFNKFYDQLGVETQKIVRPIIGDSITNFLVTWWSPICRVTICLLFYLIGIEFYIRAEGWHRIDAAYFITVSVCTVGYGFFHPTRMFTIFYVTFGIFVVLGSANMFARTVLVKLQMKFMLSDNVIRASYFKIFISALAVSACILLGTIFFAVNEGWSSNEAFYWTWETMTTVGYGDLTIKHHSTRAFAIVFVWVVVLVYAVALSNVEEAYTENKTHVRKLFAVSKAQSSFRNSTPSQNDDTRLAVQMSPLNHLEESKSEPSVKNEPNGINKWQFVLDILVNIDKLDQAKDIDPLLKEFELLDAGQTGVISEDVYRASFASFNINSQIGNG